MAYTANASVDASELVDTTMRGGSARLCSRRKIFCAWSLITRYGVCSSTSRFALAIMCMMWRVNTCARARFGARVLVGMSLK